MQKVASPYGFPQYPNQFKTSVCSEQVENPNNDKKAPEGKLFELYYNVKNETFCVILHLTDNGLVAPLTIVVPPYYPNMGLAIFEQCKITDDLIIPLGYQYNILYKEKEYIPSCFTYTNLPTCVSDIVLPLELIAEGDYCNGEIHDGELVYCMCINNINFHISNHDLCMCRRIYDLVK